MPSEHRQMTPDSNLKMWVTLALSLPPSKINRRTFFQAINIYNEGLTEHSISQLRKVLVVFYISLIISAISYLPDIVNISKKERITVYKSGLLKGRQSFDPRKWAVKSLFYISLADKKYISGEQEKDASIHIQSIQRQQRHGNKSRIIGEWSRL